MALISASQIPKHRSCQIGERAKGVCVLIHGLRVNPHYYNETSRQLTLSLALDTSTPTPWFPMRGLPASDTTWACPIPYRQANLHREQNCKTTLPQTKAQESPHWGFAVPCPNSHTTSAFHRISVSCPKPCHRPIYMESKLDWLNRV